MKSFFKLFIVIILFISVFHHPKQADAAGKVICIDPGHQKVGINKLEPIAPGSKSMKPKVSSGTAGIVTKKPEYVLVLEVSKKLQSELKKRGYKVYMTRTTHNVSLSNVDRAKYCNSKKPDLTIRVHADGSTNKNVSGIHVLYPSATYTKSINSKSKKAAEIVINELIKTTKAKKFNGKGLSPRTDLTGFNWSKHPVILPEIGFMSNKIEDKKLSTKAYQQKIAVGIANGVDKYYKNGKK
ncbi:N-acetylmuramoyl-L-alanine amidase [Bacillus sp. 31A1R]|uniref:N-acetylmuramoyl-L-alanine amidase n=1 Tax=Robertmurraya mangrovi TaxID=3098077 RepID=A0ABU5IUC2_9BACI|nr:N-acetylmuramoyl-L-alanine amidase [Bacillus sp. 31A1R]MDZ5470701.1 N-acetylmuramoyl-L-alanine amidase [Bacillus sp. 31A1R]